MAKPKQNRSGLPSAAAGQPPADADLGEFQRVAAALFQVPKSAVDEAEVKRPKRRRRQGDTQDD